MCALRCLGSCRSATRVAQRGLQPTRAWLLLSQTLQSSKGFRIATIIHKNPYTMVWRVRHMHIEWLVSMPSVLYFSVARPKWRHKASPVAGGSDRTRTAPCRTARPGRPQYWEPCYGVESSPFSPIYRPPHHSVCVGVWRVSLQDDQARRRCAVTYKTRDASCIAPRMQPLAVLYVRLHEYAKFFGKLQYCTIHIQKA